MKIHNLREFPLNEIADDLKWCLDKLEFYVDTDYSETREGTFELQEKYYGHIWKG